MSTYDHRDFDGQFAETADEKRERWMRIKARRIAEGKCPLCARSVDECKCQTAGA